MERYMKYILYNFLLAFTLAAFIIGCSDIKEDAIPTDTGGGLDVHPQGYARPDHPNFHGIDMKRKNWDLQQCQQCHGRDYEGGISKESCNNCHHNQNGPEACNTCHGDFNNMTRIFPPEDLKENVSSEFAGVGLHEMHLASGSIGDVRCNSCHVIPQNIFSPGHLDSAIIHLSYGTFLAQADSTAEVIFGDIGRRYLQTGSEPVFERENYSCSNTYCHGNFEFLKSEAISLNQFAYESDRMTGNNITVNWLNTDNTPACGTCHDLPPKGHIPAEITSCYFCHGDVIDENGNIIDETKHVNGQKEARDTSLISMWKFRK